MKSLEHYWYGFNLFSLLLLPLSWLYCLVSIIRRKLYQLNIKKSFTAKVPVVVVGNIVVGGSGKTPLLISLCEYMLGKGHKPGVVSRGYGGKFTGIRQVKANDSAALVGDEPLMICQRLNVPVVVCADRVAAVNYLLDNNDCDIIFSDDGLQHYRMKRDLEIAVIDSCRKFGNGFCLPAGPLREPVLRLQDVDLVIYSGDADLAEGDLSYSLKITGLYHLGSTDYKDLAAFGGQTVHIIAGIGNPSRFFEFIRQYGIQLIEHPFPDHHVYVQDDFSGWSTDCIIMTEKDAVKCRELNLPDAWAVTVKASFSEELSAKLSSCLLPLVR